MCVCVCVHDLTPPPPPIRPALRSFVLAPTKHPPPFMCIDVTFVHKTKHLLTFFFGYFYHFIVFHFLGIIELRRVLFQWDVFIC